MKKFKFKAKLLQHENMDATYVIFPYDVKENFGAARVKVKVNWHPRVPLGSEQQPGIYRSPSRQMATPGGAAGAKFRRLAF